MLSAAAFYVVLALLGALLLPGLAPWSWVVVVVLAGLAAWRAMSMRVVADETGLRCVGCYGSKTILRDQIAAFEIEPTGRNGHHIVVRTVRGQFGTLNVPVWGLWSLLASSADLGRAVDDLRAWQTGQ